MKHGFTLVEVMVSVALVAILAGAGTRMSIRNSQQKQLNEAANDFQSALEQARANALAGKKVNCTGANRLAGWGVFFGPNSFTLREYCGNVYTGTSNGQTIVKNYPSTITFTSPSNVFPLIFKPSGQGVYSSAPGHNFTATARVSVSRTGYTTQLIDIYPSGQITAP